MLNHGPELAVTTVASLMRADGVLEPGAKRHTLRVGDALGGDASPLEREVFEAVAERPEVTIKDLRRAIARGPAVSALEDRLVARGLLLDRRKRAQLACSWLLPLPLLGLGIARFAAGSRHHKPAGYLAVMLVAEVALLSRRPRTTSAGRALLDRQRSAQASWRVNPASVSAPLAVALFGSGALWLVDPAFAAALGAPREKIAGWVAASGYYGGGSCGAGGGGGLRRVSPNDPAVSRRR